MGVSWFSGRDGTRLAYRETGQGRPLILLHGFMVSTVTQDDDVGAGWRH